MTIAAEATCGNAAAEMRETASRRNSRIGKVASVRFIGKYLKTNPVENE
jgi:hypothetical protein